MKIFARMLLSLCVLFTSSVLSAVEVKTLVYEKDNAKFEGLLVTPNHVKAKTPAILLIHNWMGVSAETEFQAKRIARLGFIVLAADIYGQGIRPANAEEAGKLATVYKSDRQLFRERLLLGLETLNAQKHVDADHIFAVGYCFGGTGVIELARAGADLDGVISFHGGLDSPNPADGATIKTKVLALHGGDDPFVPPADLQAFISEMRTHKIDWQLVQYGGAVHSFTEKGAGNDPSAGAAYNADADRRSFKAFKDFVRESSH